MESAGVVVDAENRLGPDLERSTGGVAGIYHFGH